MRHRTCDRNDCAHVLPGRGHGWVTAEGSRVLCGKHGNPEPKRKPKAKAPK